MILDLSQARISLIIASMFIFVYLEKSAFVEKVERGGNFEKEQGMFQRSKPSVILSSSMGAPGGGLTNQRIRLRQFLMIATVKKASVFIPERFFTRTNMIYDFKDRKGWYNVTTSKIFDISHMSDCLSTLNVRVLGVCEGSSCPVPVTEMNFNTFLSIFNKEQSLTEQNGHIFLGGQVAYDLRPQDWSVSDVVDECIVYAPPIRTLAIDLWTSFLTKWRPTTTVGLHIRLEDDGAAYFGKGDLPISLYRSAVLDRIINCIRTLVPTNHGFPENLSFYVATGETSDSLLTFVNEFPFTSTKDTLDYSQNLEAISHLGKDASAGIDHLILLQTDYFFGVSSRAVNVNICTHLRACSDFLYTFFESIMSPLFQYRLQMKGTGEGNLLRCTMHHGNSLWYAFRTFPSITGDGNNIGPTIKNESVLTNTSRIYRCS